MLTSYQTSERQAKCNLSNNHKYFQAAPVMESEPIQQVPQMQAAVDRMQAAAAEVKAEADVVRPIIKPVKLYLSTPSDIGQINLQVRFDISILEFVNTAIESLPNVNKADLHSLVRHK